MDNYYGMCALCLRELFVAVLDCTVAREHCWMDVSHPSSPFSGPHEFLAMWDQISYRILRYSSRPRAVYSNSVCLGLHINSLTTGQVPRGLLIKAYVMPFQNFNTNFHLTPWSRSECVLSSWLLLILWLRHPRMHSSPTLDSILSHINPVHTLDILFSEIDFNINVPTTCRYPKWYLHILFSD